MDLTFRPLFDFFSKFYSCIQNAMMPKEKKTRREKKGEKNAVQCINKKPHRDYLTFTFLSLSLSLSQEANTFFTFVFCSIMPRI